MRPRTDLAAGVSGLATNRGVVTNRMLQTSAPNVYAMGDCAEVAGHVLVYVAPLMAAAQCPRQDAGRRADGGGLPCDAGDDQDPGLSRGGVAPGTPGAAGEWHIEAEGNSVNAQFRDSDGKLLGFALTGGAIKEKMALQKELPSIMG